MLVVAQVAVSLVLLIGAGLVLRSYQAARHADGGFDAANVTSIAIDLQPGGYDERARPVCRSTACSTGWPPNRIRERVPRRLRAAEPGRHRAARDHHRRLCAALDEDLAFLHNVVGPDYFRTLRIPIAGRPRIRAHRRRRTRRRW